MDQLMELERNSAFVNKLNDIKSFLSNKKVIIAFSGGRDSALLTYLASKYAEKVLAVFINSELSPSIEAVQAQSFCEYYNIPFRSISIQLLGIQMIQKNNSNRCYYCKQLSLNNLEELAEEMGYNLVVDGTNYSDLNLDRPGLQALKESRVESPFALASISKQDIIEISRLLNLISQHYTSQACLASRIPFNIPITPELLQSVDKSEAFVRSLLPNKHSPLRVRIQQLLPTKQLLARIEVGPDFYKVLSNAEIRAKIVNRLREYGFTYITLDLEGFQSGSMHKMIES
ncbi:ATP-dependent sacrificial sulfur transferase LarE [Candidatus Harpocratesius sp.]